MSHRDLTLKQNGWCWLHCPDRRCARTCSTSRRLTAEQFRLNSSLRGRKRRVDRDDRPVALLVSLVRLLATALGTRNCPLTYPRISNVMLTEMPGSNPPAPTATHLASVPKPRCSERIRVRSFVGMQHVEESSGEDGIRVGTMLPSLCRQNWSIGHAAAVSEDVLPVVELGDGLLMDHTFRL